MHCRGHERGPADQAELPAARSMRTFRTPFYPSRKLDSRRTGVRSQSALVMLQRFGFGLLDPAVLARGIGVAVFGMLRGAISFHLLIRLRHGGPSAEIIAERKVAMD